MWDRSRLSRIFFTIQFVFCHSALHFCTSSVKRAALWRIQWMLRSLSARFRTDRQFFLTKHGFRMHAQREYTVLNTGYKLCICTHLVISRKTVGAWNSLSTNTYWKLYWQILMGKYATGFFLQKGMCAQHHSVLKFSSNYVPTYLLTNLLTYILSSG